MSPISFAARGILPAPAVAAYSGPGDFYAFDAYWGMRAYSAAAAAAHINAVRVYDTTTTLLINIPLLTNGDLDLSVLNLAHTFHIDRLYDQTGNGHHADQSNDANRPIFTPSAQNSKAGCSITSSTMTLNTSDAFASGHTAPYSLYGVWLTNTFPGGTTVALRIGTNVFFGQINVEYVLNDGSQLDMGGTAGTYIRVTVRDVGSPSPRWIDDTNMISDENSSAPAISGGNAVIGDGITSFAGSVLEFAYRHASIPDGTPQSIHANAKAYWAL